MYCADCAMHRGPDGQKGPWKGAEYFVYTSLIHYQLSAQGPETRAPKSLAMPLINGSQIHVTEVEEVKLYVYCNTCMFNNTIIFYCNTCMFNNTIISYLHVVISAIQ